MNKKKKTGIIGTFIKVSGLFLLVYASCTGAYINGGLYSNSEIQLYGLIDFLIVTFVCMIVPFIWRIINRQKFECEKGKKICKRNSFWALIMFALLDIIIYGGIYDEVFVNMGSNFIYVMIFYFVNKWIFVEETKHDLNKKSENKKVESKITNNADTNQIQEHRHENITENIATNSLKVKKPTAYCKKCGGKLNDDKKCTKCGKQYFRISKEFKFYIVIGTLSVAVIIYISLYMIELKKNIDNTDYQLKYNSLEQKYKNLEYKLDVLTKENSYEETKSKLDFFNEDIVFVIEGYGNLYYTYDCTPGSGVIKYEDYILGTYHPLTNGEYSYKVYHREDAIRKGYKEGAC